jgi:hypothetical protein
MGRRSRKSDALSKVRKQRPYRHGELIVTKRGVYMVRGDVNLKNIQLISWEQLLGTSWPSSSN